MSLNLKNLPKAKGKFVEQPNIELGTYPARVVQIIDLGVQAQQPYQGQDKPPVHKVRWTYELSDVFMTDAEGKELEDKPRWVSEDFPVHNLQNDMAKSTKRYNALDPDNNHDGVMAELLGDPCMVTIVHKESKGRVFDNVGNVTVMRKKQADALPELKNDPIYFDLDEPDMAIYNGLPEFLQKIIKENLNFRGSPLEAALKGDEKVGKGNTKGKAQEAAVEAPEGLDDDNEDKEW